MLNSYVSSTVHAEGTLRVIPLAPTLIHGELIRIGYLNEPLSDMNVTVISATLQTGFYRYGAIVEQAVATNPMYRTFLLRLRNTT